MGSNKDAKAGNESVIEMFFLLLLSCEYFVQSVKLKHCLLVFKGFICKKKKMFSSFDNDLL